MRREHDTRAMIFYVLPCTQRTIVVDEVDGHLTKCARTPVMSMMATMCVHLYRGFFCDAVITRSYIPLPPRLAMPGKNRSRSPKGKKKGGGGNNKGSGGGVRKNKGGGGDKKKSSNNKLDCHTVSTCLSAHNRSSSRDKNNDGYVGRDDDAKRPLSERERHEDMSLLITLEEWYTSVRHLVNRDELERLTNRSRVHSCLLPSSVDHVRTIVQSYDALESKYHELRTEMKRMSPEESDGFSTKFNDKIDYVTDRGERLRAMFIDNELTYQGVSLAHAICTADGTFREALAARFLGTDRIDTTPTEIFYSTPRRTFLVVYGSSPMPVPGGEGGGAVEFTIGSRTQILMGSKILKDNIQNDEAKYDLVVMDSAAQFDFAKCIEYHSPSRTALRTRHAGTGTRNGRVAHTARQGTAYGRQDYQDRSRRSADTNEIRLGPSQYGSPDYVPYVVDIPANDDYVAVDTRSRVNDDTYAHGSPSPPSLTSPPPAAAAAAVAANGRGRGGGRGGRGGGRAARRGGMGVAGTPTPPTARTGTARAGTGNRTPATPGRRTASAGATTPNRRRSTTGGRTTPRR